MQAWKGRLPAVKIDRKFRLFSTVFSDSSPSKCRRDPTINILQCIAAHSRPEISGFMQKGFSLIREEVVGKAMHAVGLKGWNRVCIFHLNTLINMYSNLGNIEYAKKVFDGMPDRNEASWNNMMAGYVKLGFHTDAFGLFVRMRDGGFGLNEFNIPTLLAAVSRSGCTFFEGLQIHGLVLKNAMVCDVYVGTSLLQFYGSFGLLSDARMLFEGMPCCNVVAWTALMDNYAAAGLFGEVFDLFQQMRVEGVRCDRKTFKTVISCCGDDEFSVIQTLGLVIKSGLEKDVVVANSLISGFGSLGWLESAVYMFDEMDGCDDPMLCSSMVMAFARNGLFEDSLRYFRVMRCDHGDVDASVFSTLLSIANALNWGKGIHCLAVKTGVELDISVANALISMYFTTGGSGDAEKLFSNLPEKDLVTWNSMMAGYVSGGKFVDALRVLGELLRAKNVPNFITFATAVSCCADAGFINKGKIVHALTITSGLCENMVVGNALVTMYGKCRMSREVEKVFRNMPEKELVTWNALLGVYAKNNKVDEAMKIFNAMRSCRINRDCLSLIHVLESCGDAMQGMAVHAHVVLSGFESDEYVRNSLITMYGKCGDLDSSRMIFYSSMSRRTASAETWNAMATATANNGRYDEALKLLREMQTADVGFDKFSLSTALAASANLANLDQGQQLQAFAVKLGFDRYRFVANAAMDMYNKCGDLDGVRKMLPEPKNRCRLSWNVLISALARHGCVDEAKEAFDEMSRHGVGPDHVTFVAILSACSYGGLVEDGIAYFASMTEKYGVAVDVKHCVCVVNLLGRCGRLDEAEAFIEAMPVAPNDVVWRTLLTACETIGGDLRIGKKAAGLLREAAPADDSAYVVYSKMMAKFERWEEVEGLRDALRKKIANKNKGCSFLN
ncbi:putative pentatricopeptide repeat-containing protein At3g25970 [Andrographis paniculata]|uniref:putative pentatricopeptide repeat-containing protein At3g25970 n=1 Tax=Andrographis paniculata TaxID=175694 RepID=UPI0021E6F6A3|nr:putative pentatricopeptide repeat-containing protein At3g25970 [Andrographis paniculata]